MVYLLLGNGRTIRAKNNGRDDDNDVNGVNVLEKLENIEIYVMEKWLEKWLAICSM